MYPRLISVFIFMLALVLVTGGPLYAVAAPAPADEESDTVTNPQDEESDTVSNPAGSGNGLVNPLDNIDSLEELLAKVLDAVVELGIIFVTLALVFVGFKFVAAQGKEEDLKNAKAALMWTVIGALIVLGIKGIAEVLRATGNAL